MRVMHTEKKVLISFVFIFLAVLVCLLLPFYFSSFSYNTSMYGFLAYGMSESGAHEEAYLLRQLKKTHERFQSSSEKKTVSTSLHSQL